MREQFQCCLGGPWKTAGVDTQYKLLEYEDQVVLAFDGSSSFQDWRDNAAFPVRPYRDMPEGWFAHGGFVRAWKRAEDHIAEEVIRMLQGRRLEINGYSHGGGLAILAHEYFVYHGFYPTTLAFAPPRIIWLPTKEVSARFRNLTVVRNRGDIVTHLPPWLIGYRHVGTLKEIGEPRIIGIRPHYPEEYLKYL